ncbi:MAG: DUF92 domain-containing protein [Candidatus Lernaella stagnicola]|nr:DUF92 domain-containing protein [Candidatus Lernaella stagnicola]
MDSNLPLNLQFNGDIRVGLALAFVLLILAWKLRVVTRGGMVGGVVVGTSVYAAFSWAGLVLLLSYYIFADVSKRLAMDVLKRKSKAIAEGKEGALNFGAVLLPSAIPLLAAWVMIFSTKAPHQFLSLLAFVASLTTSLGDLVSTELGQAYGKRTYQLITLERVRAGTRGGVSLEGSLYGAVTIILYVGFAFGLFHAAGFNVDAHDLLFGAKAVLILIFAAVLANHIESVVSGILGQFQRRPNKRALNFLGGVVGALLTLFFTNFPEA